VNSVNLACCPAQADEVIVIRIEVSPRRIAYNKFKYPVKIGDTFKPAFIGNCIDAFKLMRDKFFAGFIYPDLVQERNECMAGMFFKITAKRLGGHKSYFGYILQRYLLAVMLHNKIVNIPYPDPFIFGYAGQVAIS
jgi:hypothetical protein